MVKLSSAIREIIQTNNTQIGGRLWLQWVLASILGFGAGTAIGSNIVNSISMACTQSFSDNLFERLTNFPCILPGLDLAFLVVMLGLVGGFMQWLILRCRIAGAGWWIPANTLGFSIALVIAIVAGMSLGEDSIVAPVLLGAVFGVRSGVLPWLVLRKQVARAGWWVPAHLLGSLAGGAMGIVAFHAVSLIGFYQFNWAAAGAMFGAGLGTITGITLVWSLRYTIQNDRTGPDGL